MSNQHPPRVLIVTMYKWWLGVARLPMALREAGFEVAAWCPDESFIAKSGGLARHYPWQTEANWHWELLRIVADWDPRLVIPADETLAVFLRKLARGSGGLRREDRRMRCILRESLGDPRRSAALDGKIQLQALARSLGIRTPDDHVFRSPDAAVVHGHAFGWPLVLKDESAAGGRGVAICPNEAALRTAWAQWNADRPSRSLKARLREWIKDPRAALAGPRRSVQRFISGRPAFHAVVAWQGRRLGGITAVVEVANPPVTGPSCVVRIKNLPEISEASEKLVEATGMTGFAGFDFMVEDGTDQAYLLECNPRPTPVSHLQAPVAANLCRRLHTAMAGEEPVGEESFPEQLLVLFPQELLRDPASAYLPQARVDYPATDPALVAALKAHYPELSQAMAGQRACFPPDA